VYITAVSYGICFVESTLFYFLRTGLLAPEADYERHGDVQDVVFPCGYTIAIDGDTINLYYGAADSSIALAHGSIRALLNWLDANGRSEINHDRRHT
jgi:predicted GH43/DUF377 family glycosyl hydrolase